MYLFDKQREESKKTVLSENKGITEAAFNALKNTTAPIGRILSNFGYEGYEGDLESMVYSFRSDLEAADEEMNSSGKIEDNEDILSILNMLGYKVSGVMFGKTVVEKLSDKDRIEAIMAEGETELCDALYMIYALMPERAKNVPPDMEDILLSMTDDISEDDFSMSDYAKMAEALGVKFENFTFCID